MKESTMNILLYLLFPYFSVLVWNNEKHFPSLLFMALGVLFVGITKDKNK